MKSLIKLNVIFFVFYASIQLLGSFESFFVFRTFRSFIEIITILLLSGLNITAIIQLFSKYSFDFWEFLSLSSAISLSFVPLLLTLEFSQLHILSDKLPAVNSFLIFLLMLTCYYFKRKNLLDKFQFTFNKLPKYSLKTLTSSPLFWVIILNISITFIIFSAYYALPDLDPFYWIQRYAKDFENKLIVPFTSDRPLFSSLLYFFNQGAHIDLYASFKYVIPLLSILMLIPAWLIARKFSSKIIQTLILLLPLSSSSTILYTQIAMPQAILIILMFYFFFFLIYSWFFKKEFFYYFSGLIIFLAYFYHEIALVVFLVWLIVSIVWEWKKIIRIIWREKLSVFFGILLIISNLSFFVVLFNFIFHWFKYIINVAVLLKMNFLFPLFYINMNGQSMGWGNYIGVIKYYLYYPGIAILLFLFTFIFMLSKSKKFRTAIKNLRKNKEFIVLIICFMEFFIVSEILPRLFSIALLPERIWIYTGIFSLTFFFILIKINNKKIKIISIIALIGIAINIGGAIYINGLKKHMITKEKLSSVEWIRENLPSNRIFFTDMEGNLLRYYGSSAIQAVPTNFYYDINTTLTEISKVKINNKNLEDNYSLFIKVNKKNLEGLDDKNPLEHTNSILMLLDENIQKSKTIASLLRTGKIDPENQKNMYIYYSKANKKDPYINRPYYKENIQGERTLIFDQYPSEFKRVYNNKSGSIIIWKIL